MNSIYHQQKQRERTHFRTLLIVTHFWSNWIPSICRFRLMLIARSSTVTSLDDLLMIEEGTCLAQGGDDNCWHGFPSTFCSASHEWLWLRSWHRAFTILFKFLSGDICCNFACQVCDCNSGECRSGSVLALLMDSGCCVCILAPTGAADGCILVPRASGADLVLPWHTGSGWPSLLCALRFSFFRATTNVTFSLL